MDEITNKKIAEIALESFKRTSHYQNMTEEEKADYVDFETFEQKHPEFFNDAEVLKKRLRTVAISRIVGLFLLSLKSIISVIADIAIIILVIKLL